MKPLSLLGLGLVVLLSSCSTAYQSAQTPDDVYYSPGATVERAERVRNSRSRDEQQYQEYISSQDDAYLRRKVANRSRWSSIDDFSYWNDCRYTFYPSTYNYFNPYFSCFNCISYNPFLGGHYFGTGFTGSIGHYPSLGWGNPYYTLIYYGNPNYKGGSGTVSSSNLAGARNKTYYNFNDNQYPSFKNGSQNNSRGETFGSLIKTVFTPAGNGYESSSVDRAVRTFGGNSSGGSMPATSSSAGGNSGGFGSTGSSAGTGRGGRNN